MPFLTVIGSITTVDFHELCTPSFLGINGLLLRWNFQHHVVYTWNA